MSKMIGYYSRKWDGVKGAGDGLGMEAETVGTYGPEAPYLFNATTFISYEDEESLLHKIRYVKEMKLYGIMFWEHQCDSSGTLIPFIHNLLG